MGRTTGFNYGNGVAAAFGYTPDRLLLQSLAYTKSGSTLFSANYWYKTDATNCPTGTSGNNGQIQCITSVMQGAFLLENGLSLNSSPNALAPFAQNLYSSAQGIVPAQLVSSADAVNMPNTNVESGGYVTNAQVVGNQIAGGSTLFLYQGFANQGSGGQAQILLHEGTHLFAGASDNQLAAAAGVPNALNLSQPQASAAYQQKLQGKCK